MTTHINIKCKACGKSLKVAADLVGKTGKCPACKEAIKIEAPEAATRKAVPNRAQTSPPPPKPTPVPPRTLEPVPKPQLDEIPIHATEIGRDLERFAAAISVAPDKFPIVEPYLMEYESARAIALQRQFPFTFFSDIALLISH